MISQIDRDLLYPIEGMAALLRRGSRKLTRRKPGKHHATCPWNALVRRHFGDWTTNHRQHTPGYPRLPWPSPTPIDQLSLRGRRAGATTWLPRSGPWSTHQVSIAAFSEREGNVADVEKYWLVCFCPFFICIQCASLSSFLALIKASCGRVCPIFLSRPIPKPGEIPVWPVLLST